MPNVMDSENATMVDGAMETVIALLKLQNQLLKDQNQKPISDVKWSRTKMV